MSLRALLVLPALLAAAVVLAVGSCGSGDDGPAGDEEREGTAQVPERTATVRLPEDDGEPISALAAGEGMVWVARGGCLGSISRIEPESNEVVATIPVGFAVAAAVGEGAVWALGSTCPPDEWEQVLFRIDPATNELAETIPLGLTWSAAKGGSHITEHLAAGEGGIWVSVAVREPGRAAGEILRIDPLTNEVAARIPTRHAAFDIATHRGSVWVLSRDGRRKGLSLLRVDPAANEVTASLARGRLGVAGGSLALPLMAVGEDQIWIRSFGGERVSRAAYRVDLESNEVVRERLDTKRFAPFAVIDDGIWSLRAGRVPALERFDARTLELDARLEGESGARFGASPDAAFEPRSGTLWLGQGRSVVRFDPP